MHVLLIIALMLLFPSLARFFGSIARLVLWLVLAGVVVAVIEAIF